MTLIAEPPRRWDRRSTKLPRGEEHESRRFDAIECFSELCQEIERLLGAQVFDHRFEVDSHARIMRMGL